MSNYIVTADWHLRNDRPLCRLDEDWIETQRDMIRQIVKLANDRDAEIVIGGDLYHTPIVPARISHLFLSEIRKCRNAVYVMGGNHALLNHREENVDDSSIGLLRYVEGNIVYMPAEEMKVDNRFEHFCALNDNIGIVHTLCFKKETDIPFGANATYAQALLDKYDECKVLFTGDNHRKFAYEKDERYVLNPGAPIIQRASDIDYVPCVYSMSLEFVDMSTLADKKPVYRLVEAKVDSHEIAYDSKMVTANHLEDKIKRDSRIDAFIETVKKGGKFTLSFEDNLREALGQENLEVKEIVNELYQEATNGNT